MQNFFFMKWDKATKGMRLHLLASSTSTSESGNGKKLVLLPVSNFISIDGKNQRIDFVNHVGALPFNVVNYKTGMVKFHDFSGNTNLFQTRRPKKRKQASTRNYNRNDINDATGQKKPTKRKLVLKMSQRKKI